MTFHVFFVARLFADHDNFRTSWTFTENNLRCVLVEIAASAGWSRLSELLQFVCCRHPRRRRWLLIFQHLHYTAVRLSYYRLPAICAFQPSLRMWSIRGLALCGINEAGESEQPPAFGHETGCY